MIGTPDPISNLRPVKYYIPPDETKEVKKKERIKITVNDFAQEREWRESCQRVDEFNQNFWYKNNLMFAEAKAEYEEQCKHRFFLYKI